jgi:hypothetical protein
MKTKVAFLAFLIVFAAVAVSAIVCLSTSQAVESDADLSVFEGIPQLIGEGMDEPQGIAIDTPHMPG